MRQNNITKGAIAPQLMAFFLPIWFGTFFQQLYNTVDAVIVGQFVGPEALAAVGGSTSTIINLLVGFFMGLSSGATVIISQFYGAGKGYETRKAVHTAIAMSLYGGVAIMIIGLLAGKQILIAMGTPSDVIDYAADYLNIFFMGMIFNLVFNIGSGVLRAVGDSKRPLYFLIVCTISNLALDYLFVAIFNMGVSGAALATIASQAISAFLVIFTLCKSPNVYKLYIREIKVEASLLKNILYLGLPASIQSLMYTVSNILIQSTINTFGTVVVASWAAYGKMDGLFWMTIASFGIAITTFTGQNFGAGEYERCKKSVKITFLLSSVFTIGLSTGLYLLSPYIFRMFTDDPAVIEQGVSIARFIVPFQITFVTIEVITGALRGMGDAIKPMIIVCLGVCVLRIIWIYTIVPLNPTIFTAAFSYPFTWIVTSIVFAIYYKRGKWLERCIAKKHDLENK